jgi:hypothetical protein
MMTMRTSSLIRKGRNAKGGIRSFSFLLSPFSLSSSGIIAVLCVGVLYTTRLPAINIPKPTYSLDFGVNGDYSNSSDSARQRLPPYTYNLMLNGSLNWWFLNVGLNLLYNSDDHFTAQRVNDLSFSPSWSWGRIYAGDFSTAITEHTLSGVSLYGGGIELFPASFRLTAVAGRAKRASQDSTDWSYRRMVYGARLGFEQFSLIVVKAEDDTSSNSTVGAVPVAPQENLVAGLSSRFKPGGDWDAELEADASLHTRDLRSDTVQFDVIPTWVYRFYQPRWSSRADVALSGSLRYHPKFMSARFSAGQVGPGYTALATEGRKNDYRNGKLEVSTGVIPKTSVGGFYERGWDNIASDKLATTSTNNLGAFVRFAPISQVNIVANYNRLNLQKDTRDDSFKLNSVTQSLTVTPNFSLEVWGVNQNLNLVGTYLDFRNQTPFNGTPPSKALTVGINYAITPFIPITFVSGLSRSMNLSDSARLNPEWYQNYCVTINRALFKERLQNNVTLSYQPSTQGNNLALNAVHGITITSRDVVNLSWNLSYFFGTAASARSFSYQRISLAYNRKLF